MISTIPFIILLMLITPSMVSNAQRLISNTTIELEQGSIVGRLWNVGGNNVVIVKGIPYAEPPVGVLRFKQPQKKFPWDGTRSGYRSGSSCVQFYKTEARDSNIPYENQSEDCLYLDVYAPERSAEQRFPVMVWIHGGSFMAGSGDTNIQESVVAANLVGRGVILVTINYRLGPFGFLVGPKHLDPSVLNLGLWDQVEALKWVRDNIDAFGGDSKKVTVIGESAGGASASILALSPQTKSLIHQAVIMSGSIAAYWAVQKQGAEQSKWAFQQLYDYLSCKDTKSLKMFQYLEYGEPSKGDGVLIDDKFKDYDCPFVKKKLDCEEVLEDEEELWYCFLDGVDFASPDFVKLCQIHAQMKGHTPPVFDDLLFSYPDAQQILADPHNPRVPILTGTAGLEWGSRTYTVELPQYSRNVSQEVIQELVASRVDTGRLVGPEEGKTKDLIVNEAYYHYFEDKHSLTAFGKDTIEVTHGLQKMESDLEFISPCSEEMNAYAAADQPVYVYSFDKAPDHGVSEYYSPEMNTFFGMKSPVQVLSKHPKKAFHGLDHGYLFSEGRTAQHDFKYDADGDDEQLADTFSEMITNFVKFGEPTPLAEKTPNATYDADSYEYYAYEDYENNGGNSANSEFWPPYTKEDPHYMVFDTPTKVKHQEYNWPAVKFWNHKVPLLKRFTQSNQEALKSDSINFYESEPSNDQSGASTTAIPVGDASYKQAWIALWVLIALILLLLLCCLGYLCWRALCKGKDHKQVKQHTNNEYYDLQGASEDPSGRYRTAQLRHYDTDMSSLGTTPTGTMQSSAYSSPQAHTLAYQPGASASPQAYASSAHTEPSDDEIYRQYIVQAGRPGSGSDALHNTTTVPILQKLPPGSSATVRPNIRTVPLSYQSGPAGGGDVGRDPSGKPPSGVPRLVSTNVHTTNPYYPKHYINKVTTIPKSHDDSSDV